MAAPDSLSFDDLIPAAPQAQGAQAATLSPEEEAYSNANPGLTAAQVRYAVANARLRDPSAPAASVGNPSYDRPGNTGDAAIYHVNPAGQLSDPNGGHLSFDDLIPTRHGSLVDAALSGSAGLAHGMAGFVDTMSPMLPGLNVAERITTPNPAVFDPLHAPNLMQRIERAAVGDYEPQTTAGRYARTIGEFAPAAALGGEGAVPRVANALLPALASQGLGDLAHSAGASPDLERAARIGGALAGGAGASLRLDPGAIAAETAAPTLARLQAAKNAAYKAVDESGVRYSPKAFGTLAEDMAAAMDDAGFNAGLHPKAAAMLSRIGSSMRQSKDFAPTLTDVDKLRQQIGRDVAASNDAGDSRMGSIMRGVIDNFIANAGQDQLVGGDAATSGALIANARDLNTRVEKLRALDGLDEAAQDRAAATGTGANAGNATRQNMIRFQNAMGNLTPDEQEAVQRAIRGTVTGNALRAAGAFSPEGGAVRAGVGVATGLATHGVLPLAGYVAKRASDAVTENQVQALRDIIAAGGRKIDVGKVNALAPRHIFRLSDPNGDLMAPTVLLSGPATTPEPQPAR